MCVEKHNRPSTNIYPLTILGLSLVLPQAFYRLGIFYVQTECSFSIHLQKDPLVSELRLKVTNAAHYMRGCDNAHS